MRSILAVALAGCTVGGGDPVATDTPTVAGDKAGATTSSTSDGGGSATLALPLSAPIVWWGSSCLDPETWSAQSGVVAGETDGRAVLDLWETGSDAGWNEEHELSAAGTDDDGNVLLALTLQKTAQPADVAVDVDGEGFTLFGCGADEQFLSAGSLTYAVRVYAPGGALAECVLFGDDPAAAMAGDVPAAGGDASAAGELASCTVVE